MQNQNGSVIVDDNTTDIFYQLPSDLIVCDFYNVTVIASVKQYSSPATNATKQITGSKIILNVYYIFIIIY